MTNLRDRLRERKLVQWVLAYVAGAWVALQVLDLVGGAYDWPNAVLRVATALLGVGLLAVLVLAWYHGERGQQRVSGPELVMLATLLLIAGGVVAVLSGRVPQGPVSNATETEGTGAEETQASLVVLPFDDLSPAGDQEYFSDGITEEILNALAHVPGLRVPGRTTSFSFKGKDLAIPEIGSRLNVAHVLAGSVRKDGERLRINAQLVDARTDQQVWSDSYDRGLRDVFAVQEEIAQAIVGELRVRLGGGAQNAIVRRPTEDLEAYNLYLRGRYFWNRRGGENLKSALGYFRQAIERDPAFARAHAALAETWVLLPTYADVPPEEAVLAVKDAAARALELDGSLAEAHASLGLAHDSSAEWEEAERAFRRALDLDPAAATPHVWYCLHLRLVGRPTEGLAECDHALELDPLNVGAYTTRGTALQHLQRFDEAARNYQDALDLDPSSAVARSNLALVHALNGAHESALAEAERVMAEAGTRSALELSSVGEAFAVAGRPDRARDVLAELEERSRRGGWVSPIATALIRAGLGEHDVAIALVAEAVEGRQFNYVWLTLLASPVLDPLRSDPRFQNVLERIGLVASFGIRR